MKRFVPVIADLYARSPLDQMTVCSEVILAAMSRNYPELTMDELDRYARICRVQRVMRPYLEVLAA